MTASMAIQKPILKVLEKNVELVECENQLRKWAMENAYTLIFLSGLAIITWTILVVTAIWL